MLKTLQSVGPALVGISCHLMAIICKQQLPMLVVTSRSHTEPLVILSMCHLRKVTVYASINLISQKMYNYCTKIYQSFKQNKLIT